MNRKQAALLCTALAIVGAGGAFLKNLRDGQHLGKPGVRVVAEPIYSEEHQLAGTNSIWLPEKVLNFESEAYPVNPAELSWLPHDTTYGKRRYWLPDRKGLPISVSVVLMGTDRGSIHKPQFCLVGQGWRVDGTEVVTIPVGGSQPYDLKAMRMMLSRTVKIHEKPTTVRGLYVYWFVADGELTPYHGERMWWMARDMVLDRVLQRWAYVAGFKMCLPGQEEEAFTEMRTFFGAAVPQFQLTSGTAARANVSAENNAPSHGG